MTYYHPAMKSLVGHHLAHGFLSMRSLIEREHPYDRRRYTLRDANEPARTLVFDTPERAAEWWAGAYGTEIVMLQIDGDVAIEQDSPKLLEGMLFLEGEITADQVSLYDAPATAAALR
jgi:hypothetical protein